MSACTNDSKANSVKYFYNRLSHWNKLSMLARLETGSESCWSEQ